jgi:poly-gamma-glutamate synthesis protein (capsule biosynthesis protein)
VRITTDDLNISTIWTTLLRSTTFGVSQLSNILIGLVGDVLVNRENPQEVFGAVREVLRDPDILFANLEGAYSDRPHAAPGAMPVVGAPAHNLDVYAQVGFSVVAMASNHILDMGYEAMLETRARLRAQGVRTCGAGDCEADARKPAVVEAEGLRVAFLGYASVFPMGYEAQPNVPGLAPMRGYNFWRDPVPNYYMPGCDPVLTTVPDQHDLANLAEDIRRAKRCADLVVTSFHWGDYSHPFHLTEHEKRTARYCIDTGADMVVGHHHHALRGMEWYNGKPIMYGLGHFVADLRMELGEELERPFLKADHEDLSYEVGPRKGWPLLPLHKDTRMTLLAWAQASKDGISNIGFLPCRLTPDGLVHPLDPNSLDGKEVIAYLDKCNRTQGFKSDIVSADSISIGGFQTLRVTDGVSTGHDFSKADT